VRIRFLRTLVISPVCTFRTGQVIEVKTLTEDIKAWLAPMADGERRAEVVKDDPPATAVSRDPERATTRSRERAHV
jgi:hypothetical protein